MSPDDRPARASIVIPAWNEAAVIEHTLRTLFDGLDATGAPVQVVVAANGCTDGTAAIAAALDLPVDVVDLPAPGKPGAIREGERRAPALPRIYLDADVTMTGAAADAVLAALSTGAIAARPPVRYDTEGCTWPVRTFYRVRSRLPSIQRDLCGAGVYGLSGEARARFGEFPDLVADDLFVARVVSDDEVRIVDTDPVTVRVPRTLPALVRTLGRVYGGNREHEHTTGSSATTRSTLGELAGTARSARTALDALVYAAIAMAGRVAARRGTAGWRRDDTARAGGTLREDGT